MARNHVLKLALAQCRDSAGLSSRPLSSAAAHSGDTERCGQSYDDPDDARRTGEPISGFAEVESDHIVVERVRGSAETYQLPFAFRLH